MGYVDENLMPDETVVYSAKLHPFIFVLPAVLLLIGIFIAISAHGADEFACVSGIGVFLILGAVVVFVARFIAYSTSEFAVTTKRVIVKVGLVRRRTLELLLQKIETIGVDQPVFGRLFGFGTIVVTGTGGTKEPFNNISDPLEFRRQVQNQTSGPTSPSALPVQQASSPVLPARTAGASRFCNDCGSPNSTDAKFCSACGHGLT